MTEQSRSSMQLANIQDTIVTIWRRILENPDVQAGDDFFYLGGDSLRATELMMEIEDAFSISLDPAEILERSTPEAIAGVVFQLLCGSPGNRPSASTPATASRHEALDSSERADEGGIR